MIVRVLTKPLLRLLRRKTPSGPPKSKSPIGPPKTKQNEKQNKTKHKTPFSNILASGTAFFRASASTLSASAKADCASSSVPQAELACDPELDREQLHFLELLRLSLLVVHWSIQLLRVYVYIYTYTYICIIYKDLYIYIHIYIYVFV